VYTSADDSPPEIALRLNPFTAPSGSRPRPLSVCSDDDWVVLFSAARGEHHVEPRDRTVTCPECGATAVKMKQSSFTPGSHRDGAFGVPGSRCCAAGAVRCRQTIRPERVGFLNEQVLPSAAVSDSTALPRSPAPTATASSGRPRLVIPLGILECQDMCWHQMRGTGLPFREGRSVATVLRLGCSTAAHHGSSRRCSAERDQAGVRA
jgi:hypothetical protein